MSEATTGGKSCGLCGATVPPGGVHVCSSDTFRTALTAADDELSRLRAEKLAAQEALGAMDARREAAEAQLALLREAIRVHRDSWPYGSKPGSADRKLYAALATEGKEE